MMYTEFYFYSSILIFRFKNAMSHPMDIIERNIEKTILFLNGHFRNTINCNINGHYESAIEYNAKCII